ncbi:MAG TPA: glycosyltransferase [Tepidisphaeraceae bacterium]|jgi:glycosyltransferase involved in cell wall biosynthesis
MNTPRIALVTGDYPPAISGIGDYVEKLAAAMTAQGADVTVITSAATGPAAPSAFPVRRVVKSWTWADRHALIDLLGDFDVAHIQYPAVAYGRSLLVNVLPTLLRKRHPRTKSLVTIHDFRVMRLRWRARVAPLLFGVDGLIHVDPRDGPYLKTWMPLSRPPTAIVPIAANAEPVPCDDDRRAQWRRELGFADDETVVAFFGILYPHKGLPELHDAIDRLRNKGRRVRLLVLGDFDRQADWRPAMEAELRGPHVTWVQGASLERISECLHASDLAALPFHSGASTNRGSLLATLAHGLPTVTTNGPCTPYDLDQQFPLSLVPVQSAGALATTIDGLIKDAGRRQRMREQALATMAQMTWPVVARQTLAFYARLTGPRTEGARLEAVQCA